MADDKKLTIGIDIQAQTAGAGQAEEALKDVAAATKEVGESAKVAGNEMAQSMEAAAAATEKAGKSAKEVAAEVAAEGKKLAEQEVARGSSGGSDRDGNTRQINQRIQAQGVIALAGHLREASNRAREFAKDMEGVDAATGETLNKAADAADGLSRILGSAAAGFQAGGPLAAAAAATASALSYMVDGLMAADKAEKDLAKTLQDVNNENARARQEAGRREKELVKSLESTRQATETEEEFAKMLKKSSDALDASKEKMKERLEVIDFQADTERELIKLQYEAMRLDIQNGPGSEEEKAKKLNSLNDMESGKLKNIDALQRAERRKENDRVAAEAEKEVAMLEEQKQKIQAFGPSVLPADERKRIEAIAEQRRGHGLDSPVIKGMLERDSLGRQNLGIGEKAQEAVDAMLNDVQQKLAKALQERKDAVKNNVLLDRQDAKEARLMPAEEAVKKRKSAQSEAEARESDRKEKLRKLEAQRDDAEDMRDDAMTQGRGAVGGIRSSKRASGMAKVIGDRIGDGNISADDKSKLPGMINQLRNAAARGEQASVELLKNMIAKMEAQQKAVEALEAKIKNLKSKGNNS